MSTAWPPDRFELQVRPPIRTIRRTQMKAAVVTALGTPPVYADFPDPQDCDGAVVAPGEAAALNNLDRVMISGKHYSGAHRSLPMVTGVDGVARLDDQRLVYAN